MLQSMTGFGAASTEADGTQVSVEVRAVNHRHLKLVVRGTDPYPLREQEFERVARSQIHRGSLLVQVQVYRIGERAAFKLNTHLLAYYVRQLRETLIETEFVAALPGVLALPGVAPLNSATTADLPEHEWALVESTFRQALQQLTASRRVEGQALARELLTLHAELTERLNAVCEHQPAALMAYRARLLDRVRQAVSAAGVTLDESNLVRELALYADRIDVSEEIHRLTAHLEQFEQLSQGQEPSTEGSGRRLEFLVQEMGREVNTLGSKAGDVTVSRSVFDLKAALEKVRELIANVE